MKYRTLIHEAGEACFPEDVIEGVSVEGPRISVARRSGGSWHYTYRSHEAALGAYRRFTGGLQ